MAVATFSLFINLLLLVPAIFMLQVFDRVLASRSTETLLVLGVGVAVALLFMMALEFVRTRLLTLVGIAFDKFYGPVVMEAQLARAALYGGADYTHGMHDVAMLRQFFSGIGIMALFDSPWTLAYLGVIFLFHPLLGTVAVLGAAALLMLTWVHERLARGPVVKMQFASRRALRAFEAGMRNAEVISAMGMSRNFTGRWARLDAELLAHHESAGNIAGYVGGVGKFVRQGLQALMLALAAWLVIRQEVTAGVMIAATIIFGRALQPVELVIASWRSLLETRAAYGRIADVLRESGAPIDATELPVPAGEFRVEEIWFAPRGRGKPVLHGVTFDLAAGESLAVLGPSASGKSTLARLLIGIWKPTTGVIRLDGADVSAWPRSRLGTYVGYLPQGVELFEGTVSENIARLGAVDSQAVIEAASRAGAHEMILRLPQGYDTPISEGGANLSGGQRQRVALARALFGDPRVVVLDEPDANLDAEGEAALLRTIQQLKRGGITQVIVSHRPSVVSAVDKVLVLGEGIVRYFGPREDIAARLRQMASSREGLRAVDAPLAPR